MATERLTQLIRILIGFACILPCSAGFSGVKKASNQDVIVHLFEWRWPDVALECEKFLGPKGYRAVQVSPPQEHAVVIDRPWYERYQPVSYKLHSRSGNETEFRDMVSRCNRAGVGIIVDAVINHMAGHPKDHLHRYGTAGTPYSSYDYPGYYGWFDFHRCWNHEDHRIRDFHNREEVQYCDLLTLTDLKTGSEYVQNTIATYLNNLRSIGVMGFRVDGSKHIPAADLESIFKKVNASIVYHEVIERAHEPIKGSEYFSTGMVTEFRYSEDVSRIFKSGDLRWFDSFGESWNYYPKTNALVFIDNHDNQRGHGAGGNILTHKDPALYALANVFMLAHPYGSPRVMSSFGFHHGNQGPPSLHDGETKRVWNDDGETTTCFNEWQCEHRWVAIANMVDFRRVTSSHDGISHWQSQGPDLIGFGRGDLGFVVLNRSKTDQFVDFQTGMSPGDYCNVTAGDFVSGKNRCTGEVVNVGDDGRIKLNVGPVASVAIHADARIR